MNLRHLEHLLAVAETGSFSRAAEQQHLTQSALSRSIQTLEEDLGARLIDRSGKRNELTPLGQAVAVRARRMVLEAAELRRSAELLKQGDLGAIRIGLGSGPGALLMTPFLIHMAQHHPDVQVSMSPGATELQLMQLRQRTLDALVIDVRRIAPAPDLAIENLAELRAGFVCRSGHPLLQAGGPVSFEELRRYPLASIPLSAEVAHRLVNRFGPRADPQQAVSLRCDDIASLIATVKASDAVYLGILAAAGAGIAAGQLAELPTEPPLAIGARFAFVTLAGRTEAPSMGLFRQFVAERLRD
ncbi:transcriptional regulator, LysR family [Polaromonas sp. OV174]|uniref:LysR substrate-binding domain-containing protein n=1 Tax=Polaromonas sp. OV174 TaxID=1855300 RepID=UPI0008F06B39|nr:LysR family transcriptional regulator [Polaromonas sp. OV174]SFC19418.1 transcriptional regulator, LysR family [Polaromonas sp. OV174]